MSILVKISPKYFYIPKPRGGEHMESGPLVTRSQPRYGGGRHEGRTYRM